MERVLAVLSFVAVVAYPVAVYLGLRHLGARSAALLLLCVVLLGLAAKWRMSGRRLRDVAVIPVATALLLALGALLRESRFMLLVPVVINGVLLGVFAGSLRSERPLVERFARMQHPDLTDAEVRYCRRVTQVWCVFFVVNGAAAAGLALFAPLAWWTLYTGAVSYALVGVVFTAEYLVRKWRFRRYGRGVHDRLLALFFPPPRKP